MLQRGMNFVPLLLKEDKEREMELKRIVIENYRGKNFDFEPDRVNLFFKENGFGKTSLCDAIRYGLTGLIPKDDVRNTKVRILFANGLDAERSRAKLTSCRMGGEKVTEAKLNDEIMAAVHNTLDEIKIVSSTEVFSSLKPGDFLKLLLKYIPEQLDFETVMHYFSKPSKEIIDECSLIFPSMPEKFDIDQIQAAYEYFFAERRSLKAILQKREGYLNGLYAVKPERTLDAIDRDITSLAVQEKEAANLDKKMREYNAAKQKFDSQNQRIKELEQKIKDIGDMKMPDEEALKGLEKKRADAEKLKLQASSNLAAVKSNIQLFERTLAGLDTKKCPISEKLLCTTDKTVVREEITGLLEQNRKLQADLEREIKERDEALMAYSADKAKYDAQRRAYDALLKCQSDLKVYKENLAVVPDKPEAQLNLGSITEKKAALSKEKKNYEEYQKKTQAQKEVDELRRKTKVYDYIVEALGDKGEVKKAILSYYLSMFSDTCNVCAQTFAPGYEIRFEAEDGVKTMVRTPKSKDFVSLDALSNGERIITTFVLMDMLNQLSGTKLLFIDNVEALDKENLVALKNLIENPDFQSRYDHIFVCGVNHASVEEVFDDMIAAFL